VRRVLFLVTVSVMLSLFLTASVAWAAEPDSQQFTLQQAIEKAKGNSKALQSKNYDVDGSYEVRDFVNDALDYTPLSPTTDGMDTVFLNLVQADLGYQMSKRSYEAQGDAVELQTCQQYYDILKTLEQVKVDEAKVKAAQRQLSYAQVSYRVGMLEQKSLMQAETALTVAKATLEADNAALKDYYQKFNQTVGLDPDDRPVLTDEPGYERLEVSNLVREEERAADQSPTVWLSEQQIDVAELTIQLYGSGSEPYKAKKIDKEKAVLEAADSREQMKLLVRSLYYAIQQLEENYASAQNALKLAEEDLRVIKVKYDAGMATEQEVLASEAALADAENTLLGLVCQHDVMVRGFDKPWAYAASA
jgi:outer membrane protein